MGNFGGRGPGMMGRSPGEAGSAAPDHLNGRGRLGEIRRGEVRRRRTGAKAFRRAGREKHPFRLRDFIPLMFGRNGPDGLEAEFFMGTGKRLDFRLSGI